MKNLIKLLLVAAITSSGIVAYSGSSKWCSTQVSCSDGGTIKCTGDESCSATSNNGGTVTCDGKSTQCDPVKKDIIQ